jgi:hypothetical protein
MNGRRKGWRNVATAACLPVILAAASCTQQVERIGEPEVRFREENVRVVGAAKILRDGEQVGTIKTLRVRGVSGERVVHRVHDNYLNALGFIDEQNCAYRLSAHTGAEIVSNSTDRRKNVAAILGAYGSSIELIEEEPAAELEKSQNAQPRRPR